MMRRPVVIVLLLALVLLGCRSSGSEGRRVAEGAFCDSVLAKVDSFMTLAAEQASLSGERYGGMAVVGTVAEMGGMNAVTSGDAGSVQHQMFVNLMTLIQYDAAFQPVPYLARSWEVGPGDSTLTFHLRNDVFWHDGVPTTAYDVAFTYRAALDPGTGFPNPAYFQYYPGEEGVEVVDSFTVRFHFRPHAEFMDPWRTVAILPEHLLGDVPHEELREHPYGSLCPVGNGPFRFVSHLSGDRWVFEANPAFPEGLGGRPYLDRYVNRVIPERATLLSEFLTGGVDVYVMMQPADAERARREPSLQVVSFPYRSVFFAAWNSRVPKLADVRVRRALTLGLNRRQIMEAMRGGSAVVVNTGVPPVHWAYDPSLADSLPYRPLEASALLEAAGWVDRDGDGIREDGSGQPLRIELLTSENPEWKNVAEIMQAQLREVGVDLRPRTMEFRALVETITSPEREFEGTLIAFETEFRLDERDLFHSEARDGLWAFAGLQDAVLDRYLDTLQLVTDRREALPLWRAYQLRILALQPYTYLYSAYRIDGVNRRLRGVEMDARGEWATLRQWWIAPEDRRIH